jgi:long-chain fatty acid transport protein
MWKQGAVSMLVALTLLGVADTAGAGALYANEFGTSSMGTAGAGAGARADDASAALHNSAGMTRLDGHQAMAGGALLYAKIEFDPDADTPVPGSDGGNQGGFALPFGSQYVHKLSDRWRLGAALFSLSGAVLDPDNDWVGRYETTKVSLISLSLYPSVAYRATDWLSIGAGPLLTFAIMDYDLRFPLGDGDEGKVEMDSLKDFAAAAFVGILLEPSERLRVGITYLSETELNLDGDIKISPAGHKVGTELTQPLAQSVRVDAYWDVTDQFALLATFAWEDWSTAESLPASVAGIASEVPIGFKDTWKVGLGAHYRLSDEWLLQAGITFDTSPLDTSDRFTAFPLDRNIRYAVGALHDWSENTRFGASFVWADMGRAKVRSDFARGDYEHNDLFYFAFSANWKKLPWSDWGTF